ncbi:MAG: rRNA pseudouridine synthase [Actinobacteria bacterium]|nr:rRNA pseudouridine synthase [Actinomycetota bacterium]
MVVSEEKGRERVQKILARAGIASRRGVEKLIEQRRVTCNGNVVAIGDKASAAVDVLSVDGIRVETEPGLEYYALNKPAGVVTTSSDPQGRATVLDLLGEEVSGGKRLFAVGRLDKQSTGLVLLTNDGFLANRLMHPRFEVQREYLVGVEPVPTPGHLAQLRKGVPLEDGVTAGARVSLVGESGGRGQVAMTLHTGKKRQIRRSFEQLGYRVVSLARVRVGSLGLGSLRPGECRRLSPGEVRDLYGQTGL